MRKMVGERSDMAQKGQPRWIDAAVGELSLDAGLLAYLVQPARLEHQSRAGRLPQHGCPKFQGRCPELGHRVERAEGWKYIAGILDCRGLRCRLIAEPA